MPGRFSKISKLFALFCFVLLAPCLFVPSLEAQEPTTRHSLSFPQRNQQYVHVVLQLPVQKETLELALPNWTPGSYVIRDHAAHLERLEVRDQSGRILEAEKVAKNRWRIDTQGARELTINYDVWAGELHVSSSWVESEFALLNGAGIFLFSADSRGWPQEVNVELPESWARVRTSLTPIQENRQFIASNYDELVDSPIFAGNAPEYRFSHEGQDYRLVNQGESVFWDGQRSMQDLEAIVKAQQEFWGENPFDREYLFLNFLVDAGGGLEHDHSTVIMGSRWAMRNEKEYIKWLALVSHEFFHSWNVRRMRPEALASYDYDKEVYTRELWLAEGLTSYYDNLLLFRARLINVAGYFELLAAEIRNYFTVPGREVRSAEQASFDSWIKHYVPDANSVNSTVSYYRRGALIGFVTDTAIRRETKNRSSLDTVMRQMYQQYGPGGPGRGVYPSGAFEEIVESVAGPQVRAMVEELLQTTRDPDVDAALDWYGLRLNRTPRRTAAEKSGEPVPGGFGLSWKADHPRLIIEHIVHGGTAAEAGVLPGDELLAINGLRVLPESIDGRIASLQPDEQVELTLARNGQLLVLSVRVQNAIPEKFEIVTKPKMSQKEKVSLEKWLGMDLYFGK